MQIVVNNENIVKLKNRCIFLKWYVIFEVNFNMGLYFMLNKYLC